MKSLNKLLAVSVAVVGLGLATMPIQSQARTVVVNHYYTTCGYCSTCHSCCHSCCNTCGYYYNRSIFWPLLPF